VFLLFGIIVYACVIYGLAFMARRLLTWLGLMAPRVIGIWLGLYGPALLIDWLSLLAGVAIYMALH